MLAVVVHRSDIADYGACDGTFTMELPRCTAAAAAGDAMGSVYALTCTYVTLLTCIATPTRLETAEMAITDQW